MTGQTSAASTTLDRRRVLGFDLIDSSDLGPVVAALMAPQPCDDTLPLVATPNVDDLVKLQRPEHVDLAHLTRRARYLLPDGQPVVWASRLLGQPLAARLSGADLLPRWWQALAQQARATVVVAPSAQVADGLAGRHPRCTCLVAPRLDPTGPTSSLVERLWTTSPMVGVVGGLESMNHRVNTTL